MGSEGGREELRRGEELGRGEGVKGALCPWTRMIMGAHHLWARISRGRASCMGAYGSWVGSLLAVGACHAWVRGCPVRGRSSFVVAGRCRPWVGRCHLRDGRLWVVGRGLVVVPGRCRLGVVCGRWVLFVGAGCCSCALGTLMGAGHRLWALGRCWLCVVGVGAPARAIVVGCGVVVGREVVVACFGGPGFQLG